MMRPWALILLALSAAWLGCPSAPPQRAAPLVPKLTCEAPIALRPGAPLQASTLTGRDAVRASCVRGAAPECVFAFQVDVRSELRAALETSDFDGSLTLFDASGGLPRELRCVDDVPQGDFHHARLESALAPGSYMLVVDGANGQAGDFELFTELEPLPSLSKLCADARPLVPGVALRESTRGGSNAFTATCGGGAQGPDHVHRIDLEKASRIRLRQQAEYDGSLYLRAQCEDASSERACNDDFQSSGRSLITARLPRGSFYAFSDSYAREQSGDYVLALERIDEPPVRSEAELCRERATSSQALREIDTFYGSAAFSGSCGGDGAPEFMLPLHIEAPTTLSATLEDPELNAVIYVRRSCADARSELACHATPRIDRPASEREMSSPGLVMPLDKGDYTLFVDGVEPNDMGAATLRLSF
ncbi:MAG TPA: hypothetical protein VFX59_08775 [Polyangiales bacterium]|nr:hypothetical protein [Polyangiales bacterium]